MLAEASADRPPIGISGPAQNLDRLENRLVELVHLGNELLALFAVEDDQRAAPRQPFGDAGRSPWLGPACLGDLLSISFRNRFSPTNMASSKALVPITSLALSLSALRFRSYAAS